MLFRAAEESFRKGLEALEREPGKKALALFEAAIELDRRLGAARPQARYLSYYGLCLALGAHRVVEGLRFCREAKDLEFFNPDLYCNLGRVLLAAGRRRDAYEALCQGYRLEPAHPGIRRELGAMGKRRRPVLPFLDRGNAVNRILARIAAPRR